MNETGGAGFKKRGSQRISGFLSAACAAVTVIPLDVRLPARSSHLPASSVGHVNACLFGVAPGGGCRVSPRRFPRQQADTVAADSSLWPCSSPRGGRSLAVTLPYGARTFLYWSVNAQTATAWPTPARILTCRTSHPCPVNLLALPHLAEFEDKKTGRSRFFLKTLRLD